MKKNIGTMDRWVRLLIAVALFVGMFFVSQGFIRIILGIASVFTLYESLFGWCAFYALIGKNTCPIS
jgi:hypothetical protein